MLRPTNDKKFCKRCGDSLNENKKCISCGKQYFYPSRYIKNAKVHFKKVHIILISLSLLLIISLTFNVFQFVSEQNQIQNINTEKNELQTKYDDLESNYSNSQNNIKIKNTTIEELNSQIDALKENLSWYDEQVAIVYDDNTNLYHKHPCFEVLLSIAKAEKNGTDYSTSYWVYSINAAEQRGYEPCPSCHKSN